ncbi:phosphotyrosine protein phosphatases II [Gloeophyllum trabeum ATCC 11539]|uniref:Phosphotyrosine protein phosphatases II n=1 Tax=Gloeophyllum trabeum (strain ATCC 11539 / FP-39264 / Madison 617) TaxID=670483 RepID=S7QLH6_GLOTA|nr:phosphotyrosine protein phosphatases II [Gloeophyllum trabeum ATCC 11539]EPQ60228.1 phosphotyrosine protein phosphatases II [Gloeophyllum trabeum ATCC 11539]
MPPSVELPRWLQAAHSPEHLTSVVTALTNRERLRASARTASKHKSHSSKVHRASFGASSSLLTKSAHVNHYSVSVGNRPENKTGNRYADIEPYDRTRVVIDEQLEMGSGATSRKGRYLNANWVRELAGGKWWIATQAPLPHTAHAFLSVILQPTTRPPHDLLHPLESNSHPETDERPSRVRTVVQLTQNFESGHQKAHVYFPPLPGQSWVMYPEPGCTAPPIKVTLISTKTIDEAQSLQSTVSIIPVGVPADQEPIIFQHMLFGAWPDHGVPEGEDKLALLRFTKWVDTVNKDLSLQPSHSGVDLDPDPPIMVNCSAGIGRTGAFIACSSLLRYFGFLGGPARESREFHPVNPSPLGPLPSDIADDIVAQEIDSLREQRPGMVQRPEQILLVYELVEGALSGVQ